jgi:aspartyl-tRNA(Asn)/glutamyl-tRNA(Gln) amidotransferase subunit A
VEDASLLLAALEGTKAADLGGATLEGKRFAVLQTVAQDDIRDEPLEAFQNAIVTLRKAGARIERIEIPALAQVMPLSGCLFTAEAYGLWHDVIEARPDAMYSEILERFRLGLGHSGPDYVAAWAALESARVAYDLATAGYDAVLLPTAPIMPPNLERLNSDHDYYVQENLLALRNTRIANLMGICALTLPTGKPSCGLMMMSAPGMEERLLRIGAAAEAVLS